MKVNHYSILPANVRYDRTLSPQSILLFGEINAASDAYGICDQTNQYFAINLNVDPKTITRCIGQLYDAGHIQKIFENGKRKMRVVLKNLEPPLGIDISTDEVPNVTDLFGFTQKFVSTWEKAVETVCDKNVDYSIKIEERLKRFSREQLFSALKNRANFINSSEWHREPENRQSSLDLSLLINSDDSVIKWLNATVKEPTFKKK